MNFKTDDFIHFKAVQYFLYNYSIYHEVMAKVLYDTFDGKTYNHNYSTSIIISMPEKLGVVYNLLNEVGVKVNCDLENEHELVITLTQRFFNILETLYEKGVM